MVNNLLVNLFSIIVLLVVYQHCRKKEYKTVLQNKIFMMMLILTMILLVFDVFSRLDGKEYAFYPLLNQVGNLFSFGLNMILPPLWLIYVSCQIYTDEKKIKKWFYPLGAVAVLNLGVTLLSQKYGFYYTIDPENIYHRGPYFLVPVAVCILFIIGTFIFTMANKEKIEKEYYHSLLVFALPPLAGVILQTAFYGVSLILNGMAISLLIVFLNIQNRRVLTDFLTGIDNRKSLEAYLEGKMNGITKEKTFSAIIIDIDDFKYINDTYGHNEGDSALRIFAILLSRCIPANDFIARFGGDEFFIVLDTSNQTELEDIVSRIKKSVTGFNNSREKVYNITFSMGYGIYDYHSGMKVVDFQKHIDLLMYEDKQKPKA